MMIAPPPGMSRNTLVALVAAAGIGLVVAVWLLRAFDPNTAGSIFPPCLFLEFTGLYCPGCGITRALHALVHFDPLRALAMNAFLVLSLPLLAMMAVHGLGVRRVLPAFVTGAAFDGRWWIAAMLAFGVLRNLPGLAWLAPGGML